MTLLDARPPKPPNAKRKFVVLLALLAAAVAALLTHRFWNYPEERAVARFLETLQQGNYPEAYRLWKPGPSWTFDDFLHSWGQEGDYGKIREFKILGSQSKGSGTVIVTVRINNVDPPLELLVDRRTKGLAYSVF